MYTRNEIFIDSQWQCVADAERIEVINPFTEVSIGGVPQCVPPR